MGLKYTFLACDYDHAQQACNKLINQFGNSLIEECDVIVALGGDGFMLHCLHKAYQYQKPVFGMNFGKIGFLMNLYTEDDFNQRLQQAHQLNIYPLDIQIEDALGQKYHKIAFNEISLLRNSHQTAKMRISIDNICHLNELSGDGIMIATPVGSTAYNFSVGGPILPLTSNLLALTPISPFRPRRWRGALLPNHVTIHIENGETTNRSINASADYQEIKNIKQMWVRQMIDQPVTLLFDASHKLDDRIICEQFEV